MRVVIDTNVVVSALVFPAGRLTWLRDAWKSGAITPIIDAACADELIRVLTHPRFHLASDDIAELLGDYLPRTELVESVVPEDRALPTCRDPADQKFLVLAAAAAVDTLVTGDEALLELNDRVEFQIVSPAELRRRLG